ncbi:heme A synthase [uncultured Aeromicrobium sp.]|uniref:COX15/CtaA family protein n=1 Tax=uncultured Aeromicrobium sp. TaxID=337820 RepID=UPI0025D7142B|nr:COX15/CtaA family protein [uncultured Aeromicrobium sp.]
MGVKELFRPADVRRSTVVRWAWASLVANTVIILTGGLVRLTGSGLGCPTWPKCTEESFVPHSSLGWHGAIEFGNRLLTYVLIAVAIGTFLAVWRWRGATALLRRLTLVMALGIPFQGVIGGITVLTQLNPWVVALHLLLSMGLVVASTVLLVKVRGVQGLAVDDLTRKLTYAVYGVLVVAIYLGTVVTGSGPHAGDANAPRNGLDPQLWSRLHAVSVWMLVILTMIVVWRLRRHPARSAVVGLLVIELAQGLIGYVQYFTDLPIALVAAHLVGAAVLLAAATHVVLLVSSSPDRTPVAVS